MTRAAKVKWAAQDRRPLVALFRQLALCDGLIRLRVVLAALPTTPASQPEAGLRPCRFL